MTVKLLAIETATEGCSAAVSVDGQVIERFELAPRQHNELILPMCQQVLSEAGVSIAQLDGLAFGCGPGAFTGLRIAASVTQAIALAHDLPVASVSTLENLAYQADVQADEYVMPAIDARMEEIYWAVYKKNSQGHVELIGEEAVQAPEIVILKHSISYGLGSGWGTYRNELMSKTKLTEENVQADSLPRASVNAKIGEQKYHKGEVVEAMHAIPVYLRNQVVQQKS